MDFVRGTTNSQSNPRVLFAWQPANFGGGAKHAGGFFQAFQSVSFRILDPTGAEYIGTTAVSLGFEPSFLDPVSEGGQGRIIIPPFTIDAGQPLGTWTIEVTFVAVDSDGTAYPSNTVSYAFRVLDEAHPFIENSYAQIQDLIDAGFPVGDPAPVGGYSYAQAARALRLANRFIERVTDRVFYPFYAALDYDGRGGSKLQFNHVVCGLTSVEYTNTSFNIIDRPAYENEIRVYNRHLRQGLQNPDDRQDPRIEFLTDRDWYGDSQFSHGRLFAHARFYESNQNVKVQGVWGYTNPDGSPFGRTPEEITEVAMRYAAREIQPLWTKLGGPGNQQIAAGPLLEERTDLQTAVYSEAGIEASGAGSVAYTGIWTGDPAIDNVLLQYKAPTRMGSA